MIQRRRILIVEDEPFIAMMLEEFMDILDMDVAGTACDCAEAVAALEEGRVDAAIVDVNLRGGEKFDEAAEEFGRRGIPFVVASGDDAVPTPWRDRPLLRKPYSLNEVGAALAELGLSST